MDANKDYYAVLGLNKTADAAQIKNTYRKMAKEFHPDKHKGNKAAEDKFKSISEAYAVLGDEKKRREYDMMRENPFGNFGGQHGGFNQNGGQRVHFEGGFEDLFSNLFSGGARRANTGGGFGGFGEDMFRQHSRQAPPRGQDVNTTVNIPFKLAALGGEQEIETPSRKRVKLKIQPATDDGKKIKIPKQGWPSTKGGEPGDLFITFNVKSDSKYERKGLDIYGSEKINFAEAMFGTELQVETLDGKKVKVKIPADTDSGRTFLLRGLGIKTSEKRGDYYVKVEITTPKKVGSKFKKMFKEWAEKVGLLE